MNGHIPIIKLNFSDMWPTFHKLDNYFVRLLSKKYKIKISNVPDILIYGCYGQTHKRYDCVKINYISENYRPQFSECDYAISFDYPERSERNYRLPLYALYRENSIKELTLSYDDAQVGAIMKHKPKFCCMVVSNEKAPERIEFFNKLSKYKKVDSGGKVLNNVGGPVKDKIAFIRDYRFVITFENSTYPGYTTEKIVDGFLANSIPIYWGNEVIGREFNSNTFINVHDFDSYDHVIDKIIELEESPEQYVEYIQKSKFLYGKPYINIRSENVLSNFVDLFENKVHPLNGSLRAKLSVFYWKIRHLKHMTARKIKNQVPIIKRI
jgi:alpha(1,3/1,4) fucosyltransferase